MNKRIVEPGEFEIKIDSLKKRVITLDGGKLVRDEEEGRLIF